MKTTALRALTLSLGIILSALSLCWADGKKISASEAYAHVGQTATVCGYVASAKYADRSKGQPTFLNLDEPYPSQIFTVLIWGEDRPAFGTPEITYLAKDICVTGRIIKYKGTPEIIARSPSQIILAN